MSVLYIRSRSTQVINPPPVPVGTSVRVTVGVDLDGGADTVSGVVSDNTAGNLYVRTGDGEQRIARHHIDRIEVDR